MKLRNLMYATMIACAFASCSKDEEGVPTPEGNGDATFSLKASNAATKAGDTDGTIKSLAVYVFNADNSFAASKSSDTAEEVTGITVKAGSKQVVVVANEPLVTVATIQELYAATKTFNEAAGSYTMNSKTYNVDLVAGKTNYLGYGAGSEAADKHYIVAETGGAAIAGAVKMYRNVAKIVLGSLKVDANASDYPNAKLTTESVFLLHGSQMTKLVGGADAWASTESAGKWFNGVDNTTYGAWVTTMTNWLAANTGKKAIHNYVSDVNNYAPYTPVGSHFSAYSAEFTNNTTAADDVATFYAYENTNTTTRTLLVVAGKLTYGDLTADEVETRYYSVAVGDPTTFGANVPVKPVDGIDRTFNGVLRNVQYNIALTVKGPGYETPFGPDGGTGDGGGNNFLNVKVQVVGFGDVVQNSEIE